MFSFIVIGVVIAVVTMYVRHEREMRRRRLAEGASTDGPPPTIKP